jgi:hypothetical protein
LLQTYRFQLVNYLSQTADMENTIRTLAGERDQLRETMKTFNVDATSVQSMGDEKLFTNKLILDNISVIYFTEITRRYTNSITPKEDMQKYWAVAPCAVCRDDDAPPNTCLNCGHVVCLSCANMVAECPFCRKTVTSVMQLYNVFHT